MTATAWDACPSWCTFNHDEEVGVGPGEPRCHFGKVEKVGPVEIQVEMTDGAPTLIWIATEEEPRLTADDARGLADQLSRLADVIDLERVAHVDGIRDTDTWPQMVALAEREDVPLRSLVMKYERQKAADKAAEATA